MGIPGSVSHPVRTRISRIVGGEFSGGAAKFLENMVAREGRPPDTSLFRAGLSFSSNDLRDSRWRLRSLIRHSRHCNVG